MTPRTLGSRRGLGLVEVLVALVVATGLGGLLLSSLGSSFVHAAAPDRSAISRLGARIVDLLLADGYNALAATPMERQPVDPGALMDPGLESTGALAEIAALRARIWLSLEVLRPGLLRLELTIRWDRPRPRRGEGELNLVRLVADPHATSVGPGRTAP